MSASVDFTKDDEDKLIDIYVFYGRKGVGKSATCMGFPGRILVISFDNKSFKIKKLMYNNDNRIVVKNATQFISHKKSDYLKSCVKSYNYILSMIKEAQKQKFDWIVIDGLEILVEWCEMVMRSDHGLAPFQGIANLNLWKDRKLNIRDIHDNSCLAVIRGLIYTTYSEKDEVVEDGQVILKKDVPHYLDIVAKETDNVIHVYNEFEEGKGQRVKIHVITAKTPPFVTGQVIDITNKKVVDVVNFSKSAQVSKLMEELLS